MFLEAKSKPLGIATFDPQNGFLIGGAHMPLITWFGGSSDSKRGKTKHRERTDKQRDRYNPSWVQKQKNKQCRQKWWWHGGEDNQPEAASDPAHQYNPSTQQVGQYSAPVKSMLSGPAMSAVPGPVESDNRITRDQSPSSSECDRTKMKLCDWV